MAILTLSRTYGCGARELARDLSQTLGYTVFEKEIIPLVAKKLDRNTEYTREHDLLNDFYSASIIEFVSSRLAFLKKNSIDPQKYAEALKNIFLEIAKDGKVIFIGRGSQFILQDFPSAVHIRLEANIEDRMLHLKEVHLLKLSDQSLLQKVKRENRLQKTFLSAHFHQTGEDPLLYHLVVNLSKIRVPQAKEIILQLLQ